MDETREAMAQQPQSGGKRLKEHKQSKLWLVPVVLVGLLAAAYLGVCAYAHSLTVFISFHTDIAELQEADTGISVHRVQCQLKTKGLIERQRFFHIVGRHANMLQTAHTSSDGIHKRHSFVFLLL